MADDPKAAPAAGTDDRRSPEEWERVFFPVSDTGRPARDGWKHAAASTLHGWAAHAYHEDKPFLLSRGDYEAALEAASNLRKLPGKEGASTYLPHEPALSPHGPRPSTGTIEGALTAQGGPVEDLSKGPDGDASAKAAEQAAAEYRAAAEQREASEARTRVAKDLTPNTADAASPEAREAHKRRKDG